MKVISAEIESQENDVKFFEKNKQRYVYVYVSGGGYLKMIEYFVFLELYKGNNWKYILIVKGWCVCG